MLVTISLIPCARGQHILDWTWPDQSLSKEELSERQQEQLLIQDKRALWVKECQGEPGKPYCKTLVLTKSQINDTGYYRCFYQDIKAVIDGTTAASLYVFVRGNWRQCLFESLVMTVCNIILFSTIEEFQ